MLKHTHPIKNRVGMNSSLGSFHRPSLEPQYDLLATPAVQSLKLDELGLLMKWLQRPQDYSGLVLLCPREDRQAGACVHGCAHTHTHNPALALYHEPLDL